RVGGAGPAGSVRVPALTGTRVEDSAAAASAVGLQLRYRSIPALTPADGSRAAYVVVAQSVRSGEPVARGDTIDLTLRVRPGGPPRPLPGTDVGLSVPSLVGLDPNAAVRAAARTSMAVSIGAASGVTGRLVVTAQTPAAGTLGGER